MRSIAEAFEMKVTWWKLFGEGGLTD